MSETIPTTATLPASPSGAQPSSSAPAGNHSGLAIFIAELQASLLAQQPPPQAGPSQALHAQGPGEVLTFPIDMAENIIGFDQGLILSEGEIHQQQGESLLAMPVGEIEVVQGTFDEVTFEEVALDEGVVDEADLDIDESSDGGDTEEMDWNDDDAEDTLGGDSSFWA
ncbi:hypothetical protein EWM64_g6686 [Hericium alpestre]|uniref:Uncharacterized protein n=1 Tax=Hericium alpestre TaxID=135208 RepID=A0A4Y9ZRW4_9AGAM|nr:hypothetical protein EWM64_g6686 [Hericium alpestre]